jgi:uncharacterized membrane protein
MEAHSFAGRQGQVGAAWSRILARVPGSRKQRAMPRVEHRSACGDGCMAGETAPRQAVRNIEEIVALEQEELRRRPPSSHLADAVARLAGTPAFVALHALGIAAYVAVNAGLVPGIPVFDPFPYGLLGGFFSLEGVLLAAFVLMKQNRADLRAEERAHLDLQISLLAEQEVTKVIQMLERVSATLGIEREVVDAETRELGKVTAVGDLAGKLHESLHPEERGDEPS